MTTMNGQQNLTDYTNCFEFSVQKNLTITTCHVHGTTMLSGMNTDMMFQTGKIRPM